MKQTLSLLFASALLVFSLTACGTDNTVNETTPSGSSVTGSSSDGYVQDPVTGSTVPSDGANSASYRPPVNGAGINGTNPVTGTGMGPTGTMANDVANGIDRVGNDVAHGIERAGNDVANGVDRMANDATRHATDRNDRLLQPASYHQMLRNAMVHDTDGFLKDGENAMTPGIKH